MAEANPSDLASDDNHVMVVAIDFGTRYSGYAFSYKGKEHEIFMNSKWANNTGFYNCKAPTSVLLNSDGTFNSFGFQAEERYAEDHRVIDDDSDDDDDEDGEFGGDSVDSEHNNEKELYRDFKMILYTEKELTEKTKIVSMKSHIFPALDIYAHATRFLKEHLQQSFEKQLAHSPDPDLIKWVITVPAIWSEESKKFMRKAAVKAGCISNLDSKKLIIALEPEAASFFCRQLDVNPFEKSDDFVFPSGTKYLVVDCGGGTNDMVAHEITVDHRVKEVYAVHGGSHGGNRVNRNFIRLLEEILGADLINRFQQKYPNDWLKILSRFEFAKKKTSPEDSKICIDITVSLVEMYKDYCEKKILSAFKAHKSRGIYYANGSIILQQNVVEDLFDEVVRSIVDDTAFMVQNKKLEGAKYILMVGGFSECDYLQNAMKEKFEPLGYKVLIPREAQLAVVKGAVLYGHHGNMIISRKARRTYGVHCAIKFDESIHDESKKFTDEDGVWCCDILETFVFKGQDIMSEESVDRSLFIDRAKGTATVNVYAMDRPPKSPVEYTDSDGCHLLGVVRVIKPETYAGKRWDFTVKMTFGSTEILVEAINDESEESVSTTLDFMCE